VPSLVPEARLAKANAVLGMGTNGLDVIGPLLAAALLPWLKISGLLLFDAATFAASAAFLLTLPRTPRAAPREDHREPLPQTAKAGLTCIWHHRYLRVITAGFCAVVLFNGVDDVALVYLARPSNRGWRSRPSAVHSANAIWATMRGSTQCVPARGGLPAANPVPTLPA
jgi:hypothetical protein